VEAKLSSFVKALGSGAESEIAITRDGKPVAKLLPIETKPKKRRLGLLEGQFPMMTQEEFGADNEEIWATLRHEDRPNEGT
jgi:antitoxin (DNA-binding transcriptional repressor) of toxin-antitoxin stability system